jgi:hypothetical protein
MYFFKDEDTANIISIFHVECREAEKLLEVVFIKKVLYEK